MSKMRTRRNVGIRYAGLMLVLCLVVAACGDNGGSSAGGNGGNGGSGSGNGEPGGNGSENGEDEEEEEEDHAEFYRGATMRWHVPVSPGGGTDAYARFIAQGMAEALGASVQILNEPGAGGVIAWNNMANAEPDGTAFSLNFTAGYITMQLTGVEGVRYDMEELNFIGSPIVEPDVLQVATNGPYESLEDLQAAAQERRVRGPATEHGGASWLNQRIYSEALGLNTDIISGYPGSAEFELDLLRGELDMMSGSLASMMQRVEAGDVIPVAVLALERLDEFPDVPTVLEAAVSEETRQLALTHAQLAQLGRSIATTGGVPEGRVRLLRETFDALASDEEFLAQAASAGRPLFPVSGEEIQRLVISLMNETPDSYLDLLREAG